MKTYPLILMCLCLTATLTCCKPSEQNYRQAYETARQASSDGIDSTIYAKIRNEAVPSAVLTDGDTIKMQTEFVTLFKDNVAPADIQKYGVVVNQFKQVFNAKALRNRLHSMGYDKAYIMQTREPLYYVIIQDFAEVEPAATYMKQLSKKSDIGLRAPFPWILKNPRL